VCHNPEVLDLNISPVGFHVAFLKIDWKQHYYDRIFEPFYSMHTHDITAKLFSECT